MTLYEKKMEAIREAELDRMPVPPAGALVEHVCAECGRRTMVELTGIEESVRRIEYQALTSPTALKCEACASRVEELNQAHWQAMQERIAIKEGRADELKMSPAELKIKRAGFPLEMTRYSPAKASEYIKELHAWVHENRDNNLWIADEYDNGKTIVVCSVGARLLEVIGVRYFNAVNFINQYVALKQESNYRSNQFIQDCASDLLIIDDLGKQRISATGGEALYMVINNQYEARKKIWLTENRKASIIGETFELRDTGEAVVSRIRRMADPGGIWGDRKRPG